MNKHKSKKWGPSILVKSPVRVSFRSWRLAHKGVRNQRAGRKPSRKQKIAMWMHARYSISGWWKKKFVGLNSAMPWQVCDRERAY